MSAGAVIVGNAAGDTVIVLDTDTNGLLHASVAVQVSVTVPPHAPGVTVNVDGFEVPLIKHPPSNPFVKGIVLGAGTPPQATVMSASAVIVGNAAGFTCIILDLVIVFPQTIAVHVSVTSPPQAAGIALNVDVADPLIAHASVKPLEYASELVVTTPQFTVIADTFANVTAGGIIL